MSLETELEHEIPVIANQEEIVLDDHDFDLVYEEAEDLLLQYLDTALREAIRRVRAEP